MLESVRNIYPDKKFIETIWKIAGEMNLVIVVDEVSSGFRLNNGGAHMLLGFEPDIAVFAKGMSNGFPMAAILGRQEVMECAQDTFISSTYWTDRTGPAAALATINKFVDKKVAKHLTSTGKAIKSAWSKMADEHGLDITLSGIDPLGHFEFKYDKPLVLKTLFTQSMLESGILASNAFYASYAHKGRDVSEYSKALEHAGAFVAKAIESGKPEKMLKGAVCHSGFKRLT